MVKFLLGGTYLSFIRRNLGYHRFETVTVPCKVFQHGKVFRTEVFAFQFLGKMTTCILMRDRESKREGATECERECEREIHWQTAVV